MTIDINEIFDKEFRVLDKGFIRLIDLMGNDASIVQAARVSYGKGTKSVSEDRSLIRYLMRNKHTSPFEMVEFKFHVKLPIFVARQWIRHRTANVNEYSGRYSEMKDDFYTPEIEQIRPQSQTNKQGRADDSFSEKKSNAIASRISDYQANSFNEYNDLLNEGLARELARINLPVSNYTEWYWKIDLHNLFHFLRLRMDHHAQYEIRVYAEKIAEIVKLAVPLAYSAFEDYVLNAISFSGVELNLLKQMLNDYELSKENLESLGIKGREYSEFIEKIEKIKRI